MQYDIVIGGEKMYKTYIFPVKNQELARELAIATGKIYSKVVSLKWRLWREKGISVSNKTLEKYMEWYNKKKGFKIHSQSKQAAYQQYFEAQKGYFEVRKKYKESGNQAGLDRLNPPYKTKKYNKVVYKTSAIIAKDDGRIRLSNGRGSTPLWLYFEKELNGIPKTAELVFNYSKREYEAHVTFKMADKEYEVNEEKVLTIDLGVIHPMVTFDGEQSKIYNGGKLNAKLQYRNKKVAEFQKKMAKCEKGSRRYRKLQRAKDRVLGNIKNQLTDLLEKYTSDVIESCLKSQIGTIVIGDIRGIRNNAKFYKVVGQKIHQWTFGRIRKMLERKAKYVGIKVKLINEAYTSQSCPKCGNKHKPRDRRYHCPKCGFKYHRDAVGAINIYRKYHGESLQKSSSYVVGELASPVGVRYIPHLRCSSDWNVRPFKSGCSNVSSFEKVA